MTRHRLTLLTLAAALVFVGCTMTRHERYVRDTPLGVLASTVVPGRTASASVAARLGAPDVEARGEAVVRHPGTPLDQARASLVAKIAKARTTYYVGGAPHYLFDAQQWTETPYSAVQDGRVALLYLEIDSRWRQKTTPPIGLLAFFMVIRGTNPVRLNRLLLVVDPVSDVIEAAAYREEFAVDR